MKIDLYALEHEIKNKRLSLDNIVNGKFFLTKLNQGIILYDPESFDKELPEGYCLYYGFNKNNVAEYFVNISSIFEKDLTPKWTEICRHTMARIKNEQLEIKRVSDKVRGHKCIAKFDRNEYKMIKQFAFKPQKEKRLTHLRREVKRYTRNVVVELADHFDVWPGKLPNVKLQPNIKKTKNSMNGLKTISHYDLEKRTIVLTNVEQEKIYEEAAHCLHAQFQPKRGNDCYALDRFFRMIIEESIGFYCAKLGNKNHTLDDVLINLYGLVETEEFLKAKCFVNGLMSLSISNDEAAKLSQGLIQNNLLKELHFYVTDDLNCYHLTHYLGAVVGEQLYELKAKHITKRLLLTQDVHYPKLFFQTITDIKNLNQLNKAIKKKIYKKRIASKLKKDEER